jgi:hypothetical protein
MTIQEIIKTNLIKCSKNIATDKASSHSYEYVYPNLLEKYYNKQNNILEVGVGNGGGLKFLHDTFTESHIFGSDIDCSKLQIDITDYPRLTLLPESDQTSIDISLLPDLDVVIEDASHDMEMSLKTFHLLKSKIKSGGVYVIEDIYPQFLEHYKKLDYFELIDLRHLKKRKDDVCAIYKKQLSFYHDGSTGDIVYALPAIKAMGGGSLYIKKGAHYNSLLSLLKTLPYIQEVAYTRRKVPQIEHINLSQYRQLTGDLVKRHMEVCNATCDLSQPWIDVEPLYKNDIIINRSERYHDKQEIDWKLLNGYNTGFVGTDQEYEVFCSIAGFRPNRCLCADALEIAKTIKGSKLFIGNQSLCYALAEALKHPRVLEVYYGLNNCQPKSSNGYVQLTKKILTSYIIAWH